VVELSQMLKRLTFVYTVPGHGGEDRAYVVRRGSVRAELPAPSTADEQRALEAKAREIFERPEPETLGFRAHEAQEVMLIARWFRRHPEPLLEKPCHPAGPF